MVRLKGAGHWHEAAQIRYIKYGCLNWVGVKNYYGFWLVNLICAVMFVVEFVVFCRKLPNPWLALLFISALVLKSSFTAVDRLPLCFMPNWFKYSPFNYE
jgi:hypothetical protein